MAKQRHGQDRSVSDTWALGQPLKLAISQRTAKNRFLKASMTERLCFWDIKDISKCRIPTPNIINAFKWFGEGSIGTVLTGNLMVDGPGNLIIPPDAPFEGPRFEAYQRFVWARNHDGSLNMEQHLSSSFLGHESPIYSLFASPLSPDLHGDSTLGKSSTRLP